MCSDHEAFHEPQLKFRTLRQLPATKTTRTHICRATSRVSRQRNVTQHLIERVRKLITAHQADRGPGRDDRADWSMGLALGHVGECRDDAEREQPAG